jgi:hypothetical protein
MHCVSIKQGIDCTFMTKKGCSFNGGKCHPVVESCEGCERQLKVEMGDYCLAFPDPAAKWRRGACNLATHVKNGNGKKETAQKLNPLKASKRSAAGR